MLQPTLQPGKPFKCKLQRKFRKINASKIRFFLAWQTDFGRLSSIDVTVPISNEYEKHILGFFKFYANFDYDKNAICPIEGRILKRKFYSESSLLKSMTKWVTF